jgi:hypothetical protein
MPDYQYPGRHDTTDPNDGYAQRIKKSESLMKTGAAAMGITDVKSEAGSKLMNASRKGSDVHDHISAARSEAGHSHASRASKTTAQKLDKFIS